jgi:diguanylate cyclase (GGDEF)-like protein
MYMQAGARNFSAVSLRRWVSSHGGVYVQVSDKLQPSPFLAKTAERDIVTPSGKQLTLYTAFSVLKSVMDDYAVDQGARISISGFGPLNHSNEPDEWEREALETLQQGSERVAQLHEIDGKTYFRVMFPIKWRDECGSCHLAHNELKAGDVSGGLTVYLDSAPFRDTERATQKVLLLTHAGAWLIGLLGIALAGRFALSVLQQTAVYQTELEKLATLDGLTGILNRREIGNVLNKEISRSRRYGIQCSVIIADLDHFKQINDRFGHPVGDSTLKSAANLIAEIIRSVDTVGRYGGEEFLIVIPESSVGTSAKLAERIRMKLASHTFRLENGTTYQVTASFGVAGFPTHGKDMDIILNAADKALYAAKAGGRNQVRVFE